MSDKLSLPPLRPSRDAQLSQSRQGIAQRTQGAIPAGFTNESVVLCYRNSFISVLLNCVPFIGWLQQVHVPNCKDPVGICLACALSGTASGFWEARGQGKAALMAYYQDFEDNFWEKTGHNCERDHCDLLDLESGEVKECDKENWFDETHGHQQDAPDFLMSLMEEFCKDRTTYFGHEEDLVALAKVGLQEVLTCGSCFKPRLQVPDPQWFLPLPMDKLPDKTIVTLEVLIQNSFKSYVGDEPVPCEDEGCKSGKAGALPTCDRFLLEPSEVLFIAIQRGDAKTRKKMNDNVQIPEKLDMVDYLYPDLKIQLPSLQYELQGVCAHRGSLKTGHYISWLRGPGGQWFEVNDAEVTTCSFADVNAYKGRHKFTPYIMAYTRVQPTQTGKAPGKQATMKSSGSSDAAGSAKGNRSSTPKTASTPKTSAGKSSPTATSDKNNKLSTPETSSRFITPPANLGLGSAKGSGKGSGKRSGTGSGKDSVIIDLSSTRKTLTATFASSNLSSKNPLATFSQEIDSNAGTKIRVSLAIEDSDGETYSDDHIFLLRKSTPPSSRAGSTKPSQKRKHGDDDSAAGKKHKS